MSTGGFANSQDDCKAVVAACHSERSEESYPRRRDPRFAQGDNLPDFTIVLCKLRASKVIV